MRRVRQYLLIASIAIVICSAAIYTGQQAAQQIGSQATAGAALYQANCAGCHMPDLGGRNEAPPLAGANFMTTWGTRSTPSPHTQGVGGREMASAPPSRLTE